MRTRTRDVELSREAIPPGAKPATGSRVEELAGQARLEAMPFGTAEEQVMALPRDHEVADGVRKRHGSWVSVHGHPKLLPVRSTRIAKESA